MKLTEAILLRLPLLIVSLGLILLGGLTGSALQAQETTHFLEFAEQEYNEGHYQAALEAAGHALESAKISSHIGTTADAQYLIGKIRLQLGQRTGDVIDSFRLAGFGYLEERQYAYAELALEEAIKLMRMLPKVPSTSVASLLVALGRVYRDKNNNPNAISVFESAITILPKKPATADLAVAISEYADLVEQSNTKREALHNKALAIILNLHARPAIAEATIRLNFGRFLCNVHRQPEAEVMLRASVAIFQKLSLPELLGDAKTELARALAQKGQYSDAEALLLDAKNDHRKVPLSRGLESTYAYLFYLYKGTGETEKAGDVGRLWLEAAETNTRLALSSGSEYQKNEYVYVERRQIRRLMGNLSGASQAALRTALESVVQLKNRVASVEANEVRSIREHSDKLGLANLHQLAIVRAQEASLMLRPPDRILTKTQAAKLEELQSRDDELERAVTARAMRDRGLIPRVSVDAIRERMQAKDVLLEFVRYDHDDGDQKTRTLAYGAFLLFPSGQVHFIDLGFFGRLENDLIELLPNLESPSSPGVLSQLKTLEQKWFAQIRQLVPNGSHLIVAPDGYLIALPFAALLEPSGTYWGERYTISYVTSGLDLLGDFPTAPLTADVIIGDPDFGPVEPNGVSIPSPIGAPDHPFGLQYRSREGFRLEIEALRRQLPGAVVLKGSDATESAFKQLQSPRILHIASHGFFIPSNTEVDAYQSPLPTYDVDEGQRETSEEKEFSAVRSGIALSGFNRRKSGSEDGVLTALEISEVNLLDTQLVVIAACDSARGEFTVYGSYGLSRALLTAGVRSWLSTLWKVDDAATTYFVERFYEALSHGSSKAEALRLAQHDLRTRWGHPYYWAPFVLFGETVAIESVNR